MTKTLTVKAQTSQLNKVNEFVAEYLKDRDCSAKFFFQLELITEEIFVNIASYAYEDGDGDAEISVDFDEQRSLLYVTVSDWGKEFDPLAQDEVDVLSKINEEEEGGLGIFMVRQMTDEVSYVRQDGKNILKFAMKI